jgi:phage tail sheath protein FI
MNSGSFISVGVTQGLRDVLYTNKVNPLTYLPGSGLLVYGQKTLASTPSSLDRINVARLVNYLRTQLNTLARPFVFEPNDPITRNAISSIVSSLMNDLVSKRGITDYLVVCDSSNNTPERIARNELYVDVAVQPTKDVEFIYIPIRLKNPGEIQAGNLASATAVGTGA